VEPVERKEKKFMLKDVPVPVVMVVVFLLVAEVMPIMMPGVGIFQGMRNRGVGEWVSC
jgi:hypothetical protein